RLLADDGIGAAHHDGGGHPPVVEQHRFDLGRVELLAAPVDDVVGPAGQVQVAVGVEAADVAGRQPAAGPAGGAGDETVVGGRPVAVDDVVAADLDGADRLGPDGPAG